MVTARLFMVWPHRDASLSSYSEGTKHAPPSTSPSTIAIVLPNYACAFRNGPDEEPRAPMCETDAYLGVDDNNMVTAQLRRVIYGLCLSLQHGRDLGGQAADLLALCVQQVPPLRVRQERLRGGNREVRGGGEGVEKHSVCQKAEEDHRISSAGQASHRLSNLAPTLLACDAMSRRGVAPSRAETIRIAPI